jgi:mannose-6-phosphate isomerase
MVIEAARAIAVEKPWGSDDLRPWSSVKHADASIGELWFERPAKNAPQPSLRVKLLFTSAPLSIQVHPTDAFARSLGLDHGKSEAWVILSAVAGSKVAVGLTRQLTASALRTAIVDGSIVDLVQWRPVAKDDVIFVAAGTIHALGSGLVVAEVQQRSDTTFRLFDFGRGRTLDVDKAMAAASAGPAERQSVPIRLDDFRTLLAAGEHFTLESIELPPASEWQLRCKGETWILALQGHADLGEFRAKAGDAVFVELDTVALTAGAPGFKCLVAYADHRQGFDLLRNLHSWEKAAAANASRYPVTSHIAKNFRAEPAGAAL